MNLARPSVYLSVCPYVAYGLPRKKNEMDRNYKIDVNIAQDRSNRCANFLVQNVRVRIMITAAQLKAGSRIICRH